MNLQRDRSGCGRPRLACGMLVWLVAWGAASAASAQIRPAAPGAATPTPVDQGPTIERPIDPPRTVRDPLRPDWQGLPKPAPFNGFPSLFPRGLGAFGAYPSQAGEPGTQPFGPLRGALPATVDELPDWPAGLGRRGDEPLPYVPTQALLVRHAERVWWKAPEEEAFVPVYFYDRLRSAVVGTEVEVRQSGEYELLFHGGGRCVAQGQSRLAIVAMDEKRVALRMPVFTKVRVQTAGREYTFELPDGSSLVLPADVPPPTPETPPDGPALVVLDRASEPGWLGGRATIFNGGQRPVRWVHAFGETAIAPGQRVQFFLRPAMLPVPAALQATGVDLQPDGDSLVGRAHADARVEWSGARFTVGKGSAFRLDPLLGEPFAPPAARAAGDRGR